MSTLCRPRARQSPLDVLADGRSVCDTAAVLRDMTKQTLHMGLFTTQIFNRRKV
jgi:hypothetical protein